MTAMSQQAWTPLYMPPEFADGKCALASDIYSLGVTCFQLLTGKTPFAGSIIQLIQQHRTVDPVIPQTLSAFWYNFIAACMSKNPKDRPSDSESVTKLLAFLGQSLPDTYIIQPPRTRLKKIAAGAFTMGAWLGDKDRKSDESPAFLHESGQRF
jgi:serine/threonine protein kinase